MKAALENFAVQRISALEDDAGAGFEFLAGVHQRFPPVGLQPCDKEALDGAAARDAPADQPRREYTGVVDDEDVAAPSKSATLPWPCQ